MYLPVVWRIDGEVRGGGGGGGGGGGEGGGRWGGLYVSQTDVSHATCFS